MNYTESVPNIVFIVPYRNRAPQLNHFKYFMKYILEDISDDEYEIYYVEQADSRPFNRGAIKNIGFIAMREKYPNDYQNISFIFNDIDTIPSIKNLLDYKTKKGTIKHFYGLKQTLGGIISVNGKDFEIMNGFPNFWGWGLEDNALQERANKYSINVNRDNFYDLTNPIIINIKDEKTRLFSKQQIWRFGINNLEGIKDIQNLKYKFKNDMIIVEYFNTKIDPTKETYYTDLNRQKMTADTRYIPRDSINSISHLQYRSVNIIGHQNKRAAMEMKFI